MQVGKSHVWENRIFGGDWIAANGESTSSRDASTGDTLALLATANADDVEAAVTLARQA